MNMKDFDLACELLPEGVTWGEAITPTIVKHIAEAALAAQAQRTTELSDKCKVAASCLTYNDTEKEAVAKHLLLEASQELRRAQAQHNQWISVEERLPDSYKPVLVATNFGDVYTCRLPVIIAKNSKEEPSVGKRERFTHWMPLPLPPAPEQVQHTAKFVQYRHKDGTVWFYQSVEDDLPSWACDVKPYTPTAPEGE